MALTRVAEWRSTAAPSSSPPAPARPMPAPPPRRVSPDPELPLRGGADSSNNGGRMMFLDGLRAVASLYVVLHHCVQIYQDPSVSPRYAYYPFIPWLLRGRAVAVFMVLSGFCLMLPVAKSADGRFRDGFWGYLRRRIRRIMPCYYVAVAITLTLIALVPGMKLATGEFWGRALPVFTVGNIASHALLLHWWSPAWAYKINPPLWTLGPEWLLYFIFPALLLPIWRRFGLVALAISGMVMGFLPHALFRHTAWHFDWTCPWFIGLFAIGMAGAVLQVSPTLPKGAVTVRRLACGPLAAAALIAGFAVFWEYRVAMDLLFGASTLWVILRCGSKPGEHRLGSIRTILTGILQSRPLQGVGRFSYSVYLIHGPVLILIYRRIQLLGLSANGRAAFMFLFAPPVALTAAWLFHIAVERPLTPGTRRSSSGKAPTSPGRPASRRRPMPIDSPVREMQQPLV
jgi:peptidoglycan/LPS O-acetylase OafA/YrhL